MNVRFFYRFFLKNCQSVSDYLRKNIKKNPNKFVPKDIVRYIFNHCEMELISSNDGPLDKKMNWDQVYNLHSHELFSVGGR